MENRLNQVTGAHNASLYYDPMGRLYKIHSSDTGVSTYFLYSGDSLIAEYQNGQMTKRYVHGGGRLAPLISYDGSAIGTTNRHFLHTNHQGSVIAQSDNSGVVTSINTYDEYGVPGAVNVGRFSYTGQMHLPEIGLYYYRARMYDPAMGRFLQTDPIGYEDQMNLYAYVHNDPMNFTDPTGMMSYNLGDMSYLQGVRREHWNAVANVGMGASSSALFGCTWLCAPAIPALTKALAISSFTYAVTSDDIVAEFSKMAITRGMGQLATPYIGLAKSAGSEQIGKVLDASGVVANKVAGSLFGSAIDAIDDMDPASDSNGGQGDGGGNGDGKVRGGGYIKNGIIVCDGETVICR